MRKFLSAILASAMLLTSFTNVALAVESEDAGGYNTLKLPVINEILDENTENIAAYDMQTASLKTASGEDRPSVGGGSGGGGGGVVEERPSVGGGGGGVGGGRPGTSSPGIDPSVEIALSVTQEVPAGELLVIEDFVQCVPDEKKDVFESFFDVEYPYYSIIAIFEKDAKQYFYDIKPNGDGIYNEGFLQSTSSEGVDLCVPVPAELEEGTYKLKFYQVLPYSNEYKHIFVQANVAVTAANDADNSPYHLYKSVSLRDEVQQIFASEDMYFKPGSEIADANLEFSKGQAYALSENGKWYTIDGYYDVENNHVCMFSYGLPAGKYTAWFVNDSEYDNADECVFGPAQFEVVSARFTQKYYNPSKSVQYLQVEFAKELIDCYNQLREKRTAVTADVDFYNSNGELVTSLYDFSTYVYGYGEPFVLTLDLCLAGFEIGEYQADITVNIDSHSYKLGKAAFTVTNDAILRDAYIYTYSGNLAQTTDKFNVQLYIDGVFTDYDKLDVYLVDSNGAEVAKTDSKYISDLGKPGTTNSDNCGTELIFQLNVTGSLVEYERYYLDIRSKNELKLVSEANGVSVGVDSSARVVNSKFIKPNKAKILTENVPDGTYVVTSDNWYVGSDAQYTTVTISNGAGEFDITEVYGNIEPGRYCHFYLRETADYNSSICYFSIYIPFENGYSADEHISHTMPSFLSTEMTNIDDFVIFVYTANDQPKTENIEYIQISQLVNDEKTVIATVENPSVVNIIDDYKMVEAQVEGALTLIEGKSFTEGKAIVEFKWKDGAVVSETVPVVGQNSNIKIGYIDLLNCVDAHGCTDENVWYSSMTDSSSVQFEAKNLSFTEGYVVLHNESTRSEVESIALSELTDTCKYNYVHNYSGTFEAQLEAGNVYSLRLNSGNQTFASSSTFLYIDNPLMSVDTSAFTADGTLDVNCYDMLNIENPANITFKAVSGRNEYALPILDAYTEDKDYGWFELNTSGVPVGYFKLKTYYNNEEIKFNYSSDYYRDIYCYNFGNVQKPVVDYVGSCTINGEKMYGVIGANLDKVQSATAKLYSVDSIEVQDYDREVLTYAQDIAVTTPYRKDRITVDSAQLAQVETGRYVLVFDIDGEKFASHTIHIQGKEPAFSAKMVLCDGASYTSDRDLDLHITYRGYTQMRAALSEAELDNVEFEPISANKTVTATADGEVTVYLELANDDLSKSVVLSETIIVDTTAPTISDEALGSLKLWRNTLAEMKTDEPLRSAVLTVGDSVHEGKVQGKNYTLALRDNSDGVYTYRTSIYIGSSYVGKENVFCQFILTDRAGNVTTSDYSTATIQQPKGISGTVRYDNGNAMSNVSLYLYENLANDGRRYVGYTYTDSNGYYKFENIEVGNYSIEAYRNGAEAEDDIIISESDFDNESIVKDITMTSIYKNVQNVAVNVKDALGNSVEGAVLEMYNYGTGAYEVVSSDAEGNAVFENIAYANGGTSYTVYVRYGTGYSDYKYIVVNGTTDAIPITIPSMTTIKGTVTYNDVPQEGLEVQITDENGWSTYAYATTNSAGEFTADIYLRGSNKTFKISTSEGLKFSGSATVNVDEDDLENVVIELSGNAKVIGYVKDVNGNPITDFKQIRFYNRGGYEYIAAIEEDGSFETGEFLSGRYTFYLPDYYYYDYTYESAHKTVTITEEDLENGYKEIVITPVKEQSASFATGSNGISANADVIAKGDFVTVNVKCQNDGYGTYNSVSMNAELPEGLTATTDANTTQTGKLVTKNAGKMKASETASMAFSIDTSNYEDSTISIPAYVMADGTKYSLGTLVVKIVSATISAPKTAKAGQSFKVTGEAIKGSAVEIINDETKEVLAVTEAQGKWYSADVTLNEVRTYKLAARVTAKTDDGDIVAYSAATDVVVEDEPVMIEDIVVTANGREYRKNSLYDYPIFYVIVYSEMIGPTLDASVKFQNMPANASVKYTITNQKNKPATKNAEDYYQAIIPRWKGTASNKLYVTVTDNDTGKEYEFIAADIIILIDPSGFVTDSETGEPIENAKVELYQKTGENSWTMWDAEPSGQQNPMYTDETGHYGWDVPTGEYKIIVSKDGYAMKEVTEYIPEGETETSKIIIPPPRTDVNIELDCIRGAEVDTANSKAAAGGKIKLAFTRPIDANTIPTATTLRVLDSSNNEVSGEFKLCEGNKVLVFVADASAMTSGIYTVEIAGISDMQGNTISENVAVTVTGTEEVLANPTVAYDSTNGIVDVNFTEAVVNSEEIKLFLGTNEVQGTLIEDGTKVTFAPDAPFSSGTTYTVKVSELIRTASDKYMTDAFETTFQTAGGSGTGNVGGGGGGISVAKPVASVPAGEVEVGTKVELSTTTKDAVIYYTTDGTEPTDKSTLYSEAIVINEDVTIKAIAIQGKTKSSVLTAKYTVKKTEENPTANVPAFADITKYGWANEAIIALAEKGIIKGVSDTEFAPANDIRRADFMLLLVRMLDLKADVTSNFDDVSANKYYYEGIGIAKALGLTSGVGDNKFNPEASITRQDMFVLAYRILQMQEVGLIDADESAINTFDDYSKIAGYAKEGLASLVKNELVKGSDNKLNPVGNATRAETAVFIYSLYNLLNK